MAQRPSLNSSPLATPEIKPLPMGTPTVAPPMGGGLGNIVGGMFESLFGKSGSGNQGAGGIGVSHDGEFDLDSFLEKSLKQNASKDGDGLKKAIGGLMKLVGLGG